MEEHDLLKRTKQFALRILALAASLPKTDFVRPITVQLVKSGTSVGANYRAACRGRSKAEFIAKIGVVEEEADETAFWIELLMDGKIIRQSLVKSLFEEAVQLTKIMAASKITARRNSASIANRKSQIANP